MNAGFFQIWRQGASFPERRLTPWIEVEHLEQEELVVGETVELQATQTESNSSDSCDEQDTCLKRDFFRIVSLFHNSQNGDVLLRGYRLKRFGLFEYFFPFGRANEVALLANSTEGCNADPLIQSLSEVCITDVLRDGMNRCVKRNLIITNAEFSRFSFRDGRVPATYYEHLGPVNTTKSDRTREVRLHIAPKLVLVCRYIAKHDKKAKTITIQRITEDWSDKGYREADENIAKTFLGQQKPSTKHYDFGDLFCGAGGVSQGAQEAGLAVSLGLDNNHKAQETWRRNFPRATSKCVDVFDFIAALQNDPDAVSDFKVVVLHLSPPCQAFSPANTRAFLKDPESTGGKNDEKNSAAIYCVGEILKLLRPRLVTMEETSGLESLGRNEAYFKSMIQAFTTVGYSVATKIVNMVEYGLPLARKRLILIASCPGCALPPFPSRTHSKPDQYNENEHGDTLPQPRTPNQVLGRPVPNGHRPFTQTVTTAGTPAGKFTSSDLKTLMGFPATFTFPPTLSETERIKQLGNAVPPTYTRLLFASVKHALQAEDHAWAARRERARRTVFALQDDGSVREERRAEAPRARSRARVRSERRASLPVRSGGGRGETRALKRSVSEESLTEDEGGRRRRAVEARSKPRLGSRGDPVVLDDLD